MSLTKGEVVMVSGWCMCRWGWGLRDMIGRDHILNQWMKFDTTCIDTSWDVIVLK